MKYKSPTIEMVTLETKDVITTSALSAESGDGGSGRFSDIFGLLPKI